MDDAQRRFLFVQNRFEESYEELEKEGKELETTHKKLKRFSLFFRLLVAVLGVLIGSGFVDSYVKYLGFLVALVTVSEPIIINQKYVLATGAVGAHFNIFTKKVRSQHQSALSAHMKDVQSSAFVDDMDALKKDIDSTLIEGKERVEKSKLLGVGSQLKRSDSDEGMEQ